MKIKTSIGVYDICFYWDKAEIVLIGNHYGIELTHNGFSIMYIKCREDELSVVLDNLFNGKQK